MTDYKIEAKTREENGHKTRKAGMIPAVVYGHQTKNVAISLDSIPFHRMFKEAGTSNLIDLAIDGQKSIKTLIHDIQVDPVTMDVIHIDFFKVNMKEKIRATVPLSFVGESRAVIDQEGTLITSKDEIEVECLPADLPSEVEVDIAILDDFEKDIRIEDIKKLVPAGVEVLEDDEEVVAHVEEPRSDEELEALSEEIVENVEEVEVEGAKPEEEATETEEK